MARRGRACIDRNGAVAVLERLRTCLAESHVGSHPSFTVSFGVADSTQGETLEQVVKVADSALYQSKSGGRDLITAGASLVDLPMPSPAGADRDLASAGAADGEPADGEPGLGDRPAS